MITFAFGDIHGCLDELGQLYKKVKDYCEEHKIESADRRFVFLGDYVDRGPDSKGVIDFIRRLNQTEEVVALRGNHEDMMLADFRQGGSRFQSPWLHNGGDITLKSFGVERITEVDATYIRWMMACPLYHDDGRRFFVHAGVIQEPLESNDENVMLWVREQFFYQKRKWSRYIVFGHTPCAWNPGDNICPIDQGGVFGEELTCAVFNDEQDRPIDRLFVKGPDSRPGPL